MGFNLGDVGAVATGFREGTQDMMKLSELISTQKSRALHDHLAGQQSELANKKYLMDKDAHDVLLKKEKFQLEKMEMDRKEGDRAHNIVNYIRMKSPGVTPEQIKTMTDFALSSGYGYKEGEDILVRERHVNPLLNAVKEDLVLQRTLEDQEHARLSTQINDLLGQAAEMEQKDPMIAEKGDKKFNTLMENISALQGKQSKAVENIEEIKKRSMEKERAAAELKMGPALVGAQGRVEAARIGAEGRKDVANVQATSREVIATENVTLKKALQTNELELKRLQEEGKNKRAKEKAAAPSKTLPSIMNVLKTKKAQGMELTEAETAVLAEGENSKLLGMVYGNASRALDWGGLPPDEQADRLGEGVRLAKDAQQLIAPKKDAKDNEEEKWLAEAKKRPGNRNIPLSALRKFYQENYGKATPQKSH